MSTNSAQLLLILIVGIFAAYQLSNMKVSEIKLSLILKKLKKSDKLSKDL